MKSNLSMFVVSQRSTIKEALEKINHNHCGWVLTVDSDQKVTGLITDGDIRRALVSGKELHDLTTTAENTNFVFAKKGAMREELLKQLDKNIRFIPILNSAGEFDSFVSNEDFPLEVRERSTYIRSRAPVRISFCGGGSDLTHYFSDNGGAVLNSAISIFSHVTLKIRSDETVNVHSADLKQSVHAENLQDFLLNDGEFGLIQALVRLVDPSFGFDLFLQSDYPMGSGLGGSAALSAAVLGCFNMLRSDKWTAHEISELAFQAERLYLKISGGWQDQYATVFGGFNFIEFNMKNNVIHPLKIQKETLLELEESLLLCDTGVAHQSGDIHDNQKEIMQTSNVKKLVEENVGLSYQMRNFLLRGELKSFGECLDKTWKLKRQFGEKISSREIDCIYEGARNNGAMGGKILGAGGGGFFLFFASPFKKNKLFAYLRDMGLNPQNFRFESEGLQSWVMREEL